MLGNLWLDITLPDLVASCCVNKVYALVFDRLHQALKDNGGGVKVLTPFVAAQQNDFAIILNEHAQRTKYYYLDLDSSQFELAASAIGEEYQIEFWRRELAGNFDRAVDILEETRRIVWSGSEWVHGFVSTLDRNSLADIQSHVVSSYDSETLTLYFMAHLEKNGRLIINPVSVTVKVYDRLGNEIVNTTQNTFVTGLPGVFRWDQPGVTLANDQVYAVSAQILDADGETHQTVSYLNCWD